VIVFSDAYHRNPQRAMRAFHELTVAVVVDRRIGGVSRMHGFAMNAGGRNGAIQGLAAAGA
jgi:hypothetical protein